MAQKMTNTPVPAAGSGTKSSCWKIGAIILAVLVALFIIFIILIMLLTKGVGDIANKEMKDLKNNDYASAYALTSSEFQASTTLDQFKSFMAQYVPMVSNKSYNLNESSINNNVGDVKGKIVGLDGKNYNIEFQMVKENSDWKILNFHLTSDQATSTAPAASNQSANQTTSGTSIADIKVSDVLGSQGIVSTGKLYISSGAKEINMTVSLSGAKAGTKLGAAIIQEEPQTVISQVTRDITTGGDNMYNFIFTSKTGTWAPGKYQAYTEVSTGENSVIEFTIQ